MIRSSHPKSKPSVCAWLVGLALVLGLSAPALAQAPPPTGPVDDLQTALENIQSQLNALSGGGA